MTPEALFWGAVGLLLSVIGFEAWQARRRGRKLKALGRELLAAGLTSQKPPLETPRVIGRIGRR